MLGYRAGQTDLTMQYWVYANRYTKYSLKIFSAIKTKIQIFTTSLSKNFSYSLILIIPNYSQARADDSEPSTRPVLSLMRLKLTCA